MNRHTNPPHNLAAIGAAWLDFIPHLSFGNAEAVLFSVKSSVTFLFNRLANYYPLIVVYARIKRNTSFDFFKGLVGGVFG